MNVRFRNASQVEDLIMAALNCIDGRYLEGELSAIKALFFLPALFLLPLKER